MRKLFKAGVVVGALSGTLIFGGLLYAQDQAGDGADPAEQPVEAAIPGEKQVELTPQEMQAESDKLIDAMREGLKKVVEVQQVARKQQDVIKLNCVNDKLLQVKQLLNIAEGANTNMQEAIAQSDENERYHQYGKIVISGEQVRGLVEQAQNCIGEELVYVGPLNVDVTSPEVTEPNESAFPDVTIESPAYASPYK